MNQPEHSEQGEHRPRRLETQPAGVALGTNYVGAKIEGSLQVFPASVCERVHGRFHSVREFRLETIPDWVTLKGPDKTDQGSLVWRFDICTDTPGDLMALFEIDCDTGRASCHFSVTIRDGQPSLGDIVVLDSPYHCFSKSSDLRPLTRIFQAIDARFHFVNTLSTLGDRQIRTVILHGSGLIRAKEDDREHLASLVRDGTNLIVFADEFFRRTTVAANRIIGSYDMEMLRDGTDEPGISAEEHNRRAMDWQLRYHEAVSTKEHLAQHPLTEGVQKLHWYRPCPVIRPGPSSQSLAQNPSNPNEESFAVVSKPNGYVVAVGTSLLTSLADKGWPYDNDRFLANLIVSGDAAEAERG